MAFRKTRLVADGVLRIAEYFYNKKEGLYDGGVHLQAIDRPLPRTTRASTLITYRMATAYYRAGLAGEPTALSTAVRYYLEFVDKYKDHEMADDALYLGGQRVSEADEYAESLHHADERADHLS